MRMTAAELERYQLSLDETADRARNYVLRRLADEGAGLDVADRRELAIEIIEDATSTFGDQAQTVAADLFDEIMEADGIDARADTFDGLIDHGRTEGKVHYYARKLVDGDVDGFEGDASDLAAYYVHRSAWSNLIRNCDLNHVMWARVPTGRETCPYCLMLASRGFAYHSEAAADHKHKGCDCVVVPGNKGSTIDGYDVKALEKRYADEIRGKYDFKGRVVSGGSPLSKTKRVVRAELRSLAEMHRCIDDAVDLEDLEVRSTIVEQAFRDMFGAPKNGDHRWKELGRRLQRRKWAIEKGEGVISVEVDEFVPCLRRVSDGEIVETTVSQITRKEAAQYRESDGWFINWGEVPKDCEIYKVSAEGNDVAQGLVAIRNDPDNSAVYVHWGVAAPWNQGKIVGQAGKVYSGVGGHLFAIAADRSMALGYDGFIYGKAANADLLRHYIKEFGAEPTGNGYGLYVNEQAARELIRTYTWTKRS